MFVLPYVFVQTGFLAGFLYLALFAAVFATVHLMYAQVILGTQGEHRFVGYADIYLGKLGKWGAVITTLLGLIITLAIYIILSASFIRLVLPISTVTAALIFWALGSVVIILSLRRLANFEFLVTVAMSTIVVVLFVLGFGRANFAELPLLSQNPSNVLQFFLPYGVVLFSLSGRAAISSVRDYFKKSNLDNRKFSRAIVWGSVVPAIIYGFFVLAITWLSPGGVSEDSVSGLMYINPIILTLIGILGFFVLWTSYFFIGLEVRDILRYDFRLPLLGAIALVIFIPLFIYFSDSQNFIWFMSIAGGVFLALESVIVVLMRRKLKPVGLWGYFIILVFVGGIIYEVFKNILLPS